jgi:hypothetical protein
MSLQNMYTCLGDDDPDLKLEMDYDFCPRKLWRRILNKLLEPWHEFMSIAQLTELLQSQFYNLKIRAGILNKMNKLLEIINL